jgi:2-hydroxychromene-2-carboxylate isomerase
MPLESWHRLRLGRIDFSAWSSKPWCRPTFDTISTCRNHLTARSHHRHDWGWQTRPLIGQLGQVAAEEEGMTPTKRGEALPITWYFDVISPFSYLVLPGVEALARRHPLAFRPVVFGALLAHWGSTGPAEIGPKRLHTYRLCQFMAERAGLRMRFPPRHPFQSLPAQRLITALGSEPHIVRAVFDFVWSEGRDPGEPTELAALCARLGVSDYDALIAERSAKAALRTTTEEAVASGVFGVPTLMIGNELFWGVDAMPFADAYLQDSGLLARGEMARVASLPVGVTRRQV